jgi:DNA-binding beta-propeller fold protein YncE
MTRILAALFATTAIAAPAFADTALGLTGDKTLVMIDTSTAAVTGTVEVQDVDRLLGIDLRPSNNTVVGVTADHRIVVIDPSTGATTELSKMTTMLPSTDGAVVVDFNPMADRLRFMTGTTNHRVNVDTGEVTVDGELAYDAADMHAGETPNIVAAAYINSFGKPEATGMFDIDATISALVKQAPPNDGKLAAVGKLGVELDGPVGFDVATTADGANTAWLAALGGLHTVDLETGAVTGTWAITGTEEPIRDITILPAM